MGIDIHSRLVIGYKVYYKFEESEVTRYDELTGKPFTKKIKRLTCSDKEDLEDFMFGYVEQDEEHEAIRGKSLYYSKSHRNINNQIEMFVKIDFDYIEECLNEMRIRFPDKEIDAYIYPDANW